MSPRIHASFLGLALASAALLPAAAPAQDESITLTLLHNNDGESSLAPLGYVVGEGEEETPLLVGGAAAFASVLSREIEAARQAGNSVLTVYAGDAFLASATLACSLPPQPPETPVYDAVAQALMPYDAHIIGNHEFDYGPDFLRRFIGEFAQSGREDHPFLSATLDFTGEPEWAGLIAEDGLIEGSASSGRVIGRSAVLADAGSGERFGVVGATTPALPTISSPRGVEVTPDLDAAVEAVQAEIDRLLEQDVDRIILVSHLQDIDNDRDLVSRLSGVDIAVAGGGDELLVSEDVEEEAQLLPGEDPGDVAGAYPQTQEDADGRTVYLVTTAGNYKYVGRIDATFGPDGEVTEIVAGETYPRRVIPGEQAGTEITDLGIEDAVASDPEIGRSVIAPVEACLAEFAATPLLRAEVVLNVARGGWDPFSLGVRSAETNGGNLVADAFIAAYDTYAEESRLPPREGEVVMAVQNGGGIRQNAGNMLPAGGQAGEAITRLDTLNVLPFDNTIVVVEDVSADQLKTILERSCEAVGGGGFLQVSGFRYTCDMTVEVGSRVRDVVYTAGTPDEEDDDLEIVDGAGQVVAGDLSARIVTNSFTADGGDDYPTFEEAGKARLVDADETAIFYEQALREYLESFPVAGEPALPTLGDDDPRYAEETGEGRITIGS
jgi:2',3'-cyclic-nucleotide 2'-phosphodiesterase / 3'-nucleotidase / 5'-nucleotidase